MNSSRGTLVVIGAWAWTLSAVFYIAQAVVQAASVRPYSMLTQPISDLANTACGPSICSPLHDLMNATFIAVGLLHAIGAVAIQHAWPPSLRRRAATVLLALAGANLVIVGLSPENVAFGRHVVAAALGLGGLDLGILLLGLAAPGRLGRAAQAAGVAGLLGFVLFFGPDLGLPRGLTERLADYPPAAMIVVFGVAVLSGSRSPRAAPSR